MNVKIINKGSCPLPSYETIGAAGMDVRANIIDPICVAPGERVLMPTGLYLEVPAGLECQVRPRSGLALKKGITVLNTPGTIDSDYRGEIGVILINLSNENFTIEPNDRIAQLVFCPVIQVTLIETDALELSDRGTGGFGSTGKK
ncbi:MAG: dUTP diphosphatase [Flavobacteriales bacterium]|jgi:dUTP pyrophosphatase